MSAPNFFGCVYGSSHSQRCDVCGEELVEQRFPRQLRWVPGTGGFVPADYTSEWIHWLGKPCPGA